MGLCPIAPPKGFPSVYGACLAHRPLETFGRKYLILFQYFSKKQILYKMRARNARPYGYAVAFFATL